MITHLKSHLKQNQVLLRQYETFQTQVIEKVPYDESEGKEVHFLPHHGVVRMDKDTTKL